MGSRLTNETAGKALKKLKAENVTPKGSPHPRFAIIYNDEIVAETGLRHSSKRDKGVGHVKRDLRVSERFVLELANCSKYLDDWLRELGLLVEVTKQPDETA